MTSNNDNDSNHYNGYENDKNKWDRERECVEPLVVAGSGCGFHGLPWSELHGEAFLPLQDDVPAQLEVVLRDFGANFKLTKHGREQDLKLQHRVFSTLKKKRKHREENR